MAPESLKGFPQPMRAQMESGPMPLTPKVNIQMSQKARRHPVRYPEPGKPKEK